MWTAEVKSGIKYEVKNNSFKYNLSVIMNGILGDGEGGILHLFDQHTDAN